jgi:hypothetical protein
MGGYLEADLTAAAEGVYGSYAAGVILRETGTGSLRLGGRAGARIIDVVTPLLYADMGLEGELFVAPTIALGLDVGTAIPLGDGSRDTGSHRVDVAAKGGPERLRFGLAWYLGR